jgi:putative membrane-bound dehydrogenase-like protein
MLLACFPRIPTMRQITVIITSFCLLPIAFAGDGNRLAYLDEADPYYPNRSFPKLITPQWVGEDGVEAVVVLAIDDMRGHEKWEQFLRPILNRLKKIDGRAPVSIMTCSIDPNHPHLQAWLKEGVSLECHTVDHPCPLLYGGDFAKAKSTYDRCIDLLSLVPNSRPVAFRTPCCDSLNTVSPRIFSEIFNKTTPNGNFLQIDSSVFNLFTANDPDLPRELVLQSDGSERFRKYLPRDRTFVNTIQDYPYPYVIGRTCWEFPCVTPSDWSAQHYHKQNASPVTLRDWQAALDCTVKKQGVFCLVFHPYDWSTPQMIVDLIDHAVAKHGKKVKFLNFRDCLERLNKNLLVGNPLRDQKTGATGFSALGRSIGESNLGRNIASNSTCVILYSEEQEIKGIREWMREPGGKYHWVTHDFIVVKNGLATKELKFFKYVHLGDQWAAIRGYENEQLITIPNAAQDTIPNAAQEWETKLKFALPPGVKLGNPSSDSGLRFIDLDGDGFDDVVFSNEKEYGIYLFTDMKHGWSRKVMAGKQGEPGALPPIAINGKNNGFFVHGRSLYWQNENTNLNKDHIDKRSFNELLQNEEPKAKSPEESLKSIQVKPGFKVELVASEPRVQSPIAFAWGPDGKLWVVEMGDYPLGLDGKGNPGGRIKYLESTKGDGKFDRATVFLDKLSFPTGVLLWRKGVIVTCAPEIFYAEDTKGNGKADKKEVLYTGFVEGNPQHRVNSLVWGLDNWIYVANGDSGGKIKSVKTGKTIDIGHRDLRIRPDTGEMDAVTGTTQYGRSRDDWGNWFGNNNSNPLWHYVLDDHYIRRNPHVAPPETRAHVPVEPGAARVYPISRTLPRFNDPSGANHFTSACSPIVYRDELFYQSRERSNQSRERERPVAHKTSVANAPGSEIQWVFISEPVHNLIHREIMAPKGVTFTSRRAEDERESEFLASSDNWFRPTMIQTGPDGCLWIADMYRQVIEHPEWIPKDWQKRLDLRAGADKGRIYRVVPVGVKPRAIPRLDKLDTAGLVAALDSSNGWQRDTAQMMLLWRNDKTAVPLLEKMATENKNPLARLHALCTLDGLGANNKDVLAKAYKDEHPGVRRHAIRLSEKPIGGSRPPLLEFKLVRDPDPQVRLQYVYSRRGAPVESNDLKDPYMLAALMSSVTEKDLDQITGIGPEAIDGKLPMNHVRNLLSFAMAKNNKKAVQRVLMDISLRAPKSSRSFETLAVVLDVLDDHNQLLARWAQKPDSDFMLALVGLEKYFDAARKTVADGKAPLDERVQAARILGRGPDHQSEEIKLLSGLLTPDTPPELQAAAMTELARLRDDDVLAILLKGWKGYSPALRSQVLDALFPRDKGVNSILNSLEQKEISPIEIDAARRQRLLQQKNTELRERAAKLFAGSINADRQKVVDSYRSVLTTKGDPKRGAQIFTKTCATCHRFQGVGEEVGPDLASLGDKSPEALLTAILDPNRAVEARYIAYIAVTKSGVSYNGLLASETGNSVTIVSQDGKKHTILRTELEALSSTDKSAMPEGLEKDLKPQDVADVIAHLRVGVPAAARKTFEGNKPEVIRPDKDGTLRLSATTCEIYGSTLGFDPLRVKITDWNSEDDRAVWTIETPAAGKYTLSLEYACGDRSAGNKFLVEAGEKRVTGVVAGTGGWSDYKQVKIGDIELSAGKQQVTLHSSGKINGALLELRTIRLVPTAK